MTENGSGQEPGGQPHPAEREPSSEEEKQLLTPEEQATLSPAEQRALARKRLADRIRATIPDEQRRMTKRGAVQPRVPEASPVPPTLPVAPQVPPASPGQPSPPIAPPAAPARSEDTPTTASKTGAGVEPSERAPRRRRAAPELPGRRMPPPGMRPPRGTRRPPREGLPVALARPTNLPTRAREPGKVHPIGVAILIGIAVAVAYFFADIWGVFFVPLLLVLLWRKVDSRELLGITAVVVASIPLIMVIQGIDLKGNIDSSYALKQMLAHSVAGIAIGLLATACVVAAVDWRYRVLPLDPAGDPNDEPVLVSFLPSRKGLRARGVVKARPIKQEGSTT
ncbi:MAG: hypothetical protein C4319_01610 [Acidimicrobiia bacterium]